MLPKYNPTEEVGFGVCLWHFVDHLDVPLHFQLLTDSGRDRRPSPHASKGPRRSADERPV